MVNLGIKDRINRRIRAQAIKKAVKKHDELEGLLEHELLQLMTIEDIDSPTSGPDAGLFTIFNQDVYAQVFLIGVREKYNPMLKEYSENYDLATIDRVLNLCTIDEANVILSHNVIGLPENTKQGLVKRAQDTVKRVNAQINRNRVKAVNAAVNKKEEKKLDAHTNVLLDGMDSYALFAMPCVVLSHDKGIVRAAVQKLRDTLLEGGIRTVIPRYAQLSAIQLALPTNVVPIQFFQPVNGRTIASVSPLRAIHAFAETGPIWFDELDTLYPIHIQPTLDDPEGTFVIGPPGSGKTTLFCKVAASARALGCNVAIVEPKEETKKGTDYRGYVKSNGGAIAIFGPGGNNPCPLIIPFDKTMMGTSYVTYCKAKDYWIDTVESIVTAWLGKLTDRQPGFLISTLIGLYMKRNILKPNGDPDNTELWDVPGALDWPSLHDWRMYMKEEWNNPASEYYKDPSVISLYHRMIKAMVGGTFWWWANSKEHYKFDNKLKLLDISGVPDSLQSAVTIQVLGTLNTAYYANDEVENRPHTYIILDEVHHILDCEEAWPAINKCISRGRAPGVTGILGTQHPIVKPSQRPFIQMINANCRNLIIMNNLTSRNVDLYCDPFNIDPRDRVELQQMGSGYGMYFRDDRGVKFVVRLDEKLENELLASQRAAGTEDLVSERATERGLAVEEVYRPIYDKEHMFITDWLVSEARSSYPGYAYQNPVDPLSRGGKKAAYILEDQIKYVEGTRADGKKYQDLVGPEGVTHFLAVCIIAGWMRMHGFEDVEIHHNNKADITWRGGCLEYEMPGTHNTVEAWNDKLKRAREAGYKHIIFTGIGSVCTEMKEKEGTEVTAYVYPQGEKYLRAKLESIWKENLEREGQKVRPNSPSPEAAEA